MTEALAPFRATGTLVDTRLVRAGLRLALSEMELETETLDLDDPRVLARERLRPSQVATRDRSVTQAQAERLHAGHPRVGALLWWSTLESSWQNVTIFDRAAAKLELRASEALGLDHPVVREAAGFLGLRVG